VCDSALTGLFELLVMFFGMTNSPVDGDQREFDLEIRVTTNGNNKTPRCFTVVH